MRQMTEEQQEKRQRTLEWRVRWRWPATVLCLFGIAIQIAVILNKHSQWPMLFRCPPWASISFPHSVWINIFDVTIASIALFQWWQRVHNYHREQLAAEQETLRKAAPPAGGIRPPPPVS